MREIGKKRQDLEGVEYGVLFKKNTHTQNWKYFSMAEAQSGTRFKIRGKKEGSSQEGSCLLLNLDCILSGVEIHDDQIRCLKKYMITV